MRLTSTLIRIAGLVVISLTYAAVLKAQQLKPSPVPETPAPPVTPAPASPSNIDFPVSAPAPSLQVVEDSICDLVTGVTDPVIVWPLDLGRFNYEVWRERPLDELRFHDNQFSMSEYIYYWADNGDIGCGWDDEPPSQVIVGLDSKIKWGSKWNLETSTTIRPFQSKRDCLMSHWNYNVTEKLAPYAHNLLQKGASEFDRQLKAKSNYRARAAEVWADLQQPQDLGGGSWFLLQPSAVSAGPITFSQTTPQTIDTVFALTADPVVVTGPMPTPTPSPLPDIQVVPDPTGFHVVADVGISFAEITRLLQDPQTGLVGKTYAYNRRELKIVGARAYGSGDHIALELVVQARALPGKRPKIVDVATLFVNVFRRLQYAWEKHFYKLSGTIYLTAQPGYSSDQRAVRLADPQFDAATLKAIMKKAKWIVQTSLIQSTNENVQGPIGDKLDSLKDHVNGVLNRNIGLYANIRGNVDGVNVQNVFVGDNAVKARVKVDGRGTLTVDWLK